MGGYRVKLPGVAWMFAAALCFTVVNILVKEITVGHGADVLWVVFVRYAIGLAVITAPGLFGAWSLRIHNVRAFVLRGAFGAAAQILLLLSITYVGLGRGTVLGYLLGVVAAVAGIFILNERPRPIVFLAVLLGTAGVFLTCDAHLPRGAEWLGVGTAVCAGLALSYVRLMRRTDAVHVPIVSKCLFGTVVPACFLWFRPVPRGAGVWTLIVAMALMDLVAGLCQNAGLGRVPVARATAIMMLTPVLVLAVGFAFYDEPMSAVQWAGCTTVLCASYMAVRARQGDVTQPAPPAS